MNRLFLRIYANASTDEASALAAVMEAALALYEPTAAASPRRYWKMPELFEFSYHLSSPTRDIWDELVSQHPEGWTVVEDGAECSAVWNRAVDRVLLAPAVRWAELATLHAA